MKLWHMYDCTDYAVNLFNCPTVAYSGEIDKQKQAADMMAKALEAEGITLTHLIGPKTAYAYHKETKQEINERIDRIAARGRNVVPTKVRFTTWTLRYNECLWVRVDGMNAHWERARVDAELVGDGVKVKTENVRGLTLSMRAGECPFDNTHKPKVVLDGQEVECAPALSDRSWTAHFRKADRWAAVGSPTEEGLHKIHGLQGPIDDAFMDSFLIVKPSGTPLNKEVGAWEEAEMNHAIAHWRNQFRGEPRVKTDDEITDANSPLTIWSFGATQRAIGF